MCRNAAAPMLMERPMQLHFPHIRTAAWLALGAALVTLPASAESVDAEKRRLCTGDAFRLCSSEIPNVELVTTCMRKQKANLSDGCKAVFDKDEVSSVAAPPPSSPN
jgi:hypothetical protein